MRTRVWALSEFVEAMKLSDKIRYLREVEGQLRGLERAMTQGELVRAVREEMGVAEGNGTEPELSVADRERSAAAPDEHDAAVAGAIFQGASRIPG